MKATKKTTTKTKTAKKPAVKKVRRTRKAQPKSRKPSRKALMNELILIEQEGQIYQKMLRDARLKKEALIVKSVKSALKSLAKRQRVAFKALGI